MFLMRYHAFRPEGAKAFSRGRSPLGTSPRIRFANSFRPEGAKAKSHTDISLIISYSMLFQQSNQFVLECDCFMMLGLLLNVFDNLRQY